MTPAAIIEAAHAVGVELFPEGDAVRVRPAGVLSPELKAAIVANKAGVLAILRTPKPEPSDACGGCGSTAWIASLVDEDGSRTCADCLLGVTGVRRTGAAVRPPRAQARSQEKG